MKLPSTDTHFKPSDWDNYQRMQYDYALAHCKQRRIALDCGAHVGIQAHRMAEQFEFVYAFEPVWVELLAHNMRDYRNWQLCPYALGSETGTTSFTINPENTGGTHTTPGDDYPVRTIDSLGLHSVDFVKMDLEGCELAALQGAEQTIRACKPVLMLEIERDAQDRQQIYQLLKSWGYTHLLRKNADTIWASK